MTDRRKRKTQQAVQTAFAKLISTKDIKDITIKELCEEADINKSTFIYITEIFMTAQIVL